MHRLSKIECYLPDNMFRSILSQMKVWGQEESGWVAEPVPNWESSATQFDLSGEGGAALRALR